MGYYFEKLRPLAAGILVSGAGLGMLAGAPLVRFLFDTYGLNGMFLLLGALGSHACVGGMLMRPPKHEATGGDVSAQNNRERGEENQPFTKLRNLLREFCDLFSRYGFILYVSYVLENQHFKSTCRTMLSQREHRPKTPPCYSLRWA